MNGDQFKSANPIFLCRVDPKLEPINLRMLQGAFFVLAFGYVMAGKHVCSCDDPCSLLLFKHFILYCTCFIYIYCVSYILYSSIVSFCVAFYIFFPI